MQTRRACAELARPGDSDSIDFDLTRRLPSHDAFSSCFSNSAPEASVPEDDLHLALDSSGVFCQGLGEEARPPVGQLRVAELAETLLAAERGRGCVSEPPASEGGCPLVTGIVSTHFLPQQRSCQRAEQLVCTKRGHLHGRTS